jgi:hypothetical protein
MSDSQPRSETPHKLAALHPLVLIGLFTVVDACAVGMHFINEKSEHHSRFFRLARDRGFAEIIQYVKLGVIISLLVTWHKARPARVLKAWIILFTILLLDDSLGIHEWLGGLIVADTGERGPFGVRMKDLAEIVPLIALEGSALLYVGLQFLRADPLMRRVSLGIGLALGPYIASSLLLDLVPMPLAEQLGEMFCMSILLVVVHTLFRAHGPSARSVALER